MPDLVYYRHMSSPIGKLLLTSDGEALTGLHMTGLAEDSSPVPDASWTQDDRAFVRVCEQLEAYFEGESVTFDLPLGLGGTAFQRRVWQALCAIPYGVAISYAELARRIGQPGASRAVGSANGRNPVAIIVPCHRVIGADGGLGGYGGGLDRKRWLLEHEAEVLARHPEWRATPSAGTITPRLLRA
ncbi:MAG: methylated-DNA--[protein]-cysteine S-methyltransferase [Isosphaeraceae bacterium]